MHPGALLDLTTSLVQSVLRLDQPADRVVSSFFQQHRQLGQRERHTLAETAYTVLRRRLLLQHLAQSGAGPLPRRLAILAWQGSIDFLQGGLSEPERHWSAAMRQQNLSALPDKLRFNLPDWISEPLKARLGDEDFRALAESMDHQAPLDLRVNALTARRDEVRHTLAEAGIASEPTVYSPWGLRVEGKPALTRLDAFNQGHMEVQDEGSQLLALITGASRGEMVVDFCAGAGGKTLALGAMMRNTGRLYAFDTSDHRLAALKPRLARSGLSNVHPAKLAHERDERVKRLQGKIDRVLVDAPCSGLGTLRRNPDLKWRQTPEIVQSLTQQQAAILASAARLVRPGGRLVYATCSLLADENERVAEAFTAEHLSGTLAFRPEPVLSILQAAKVERAEELVDGDFLRLWPHRHRTDGFFAAAWTRV